MTDRREQQRDLRATLEIILGSYDSVRLDDETDRRWLADRISAELLDDYQIERRDDG